VKPKNYPTEKVAAVAKTLAEAPALPPRFIPHADTIAELSKHIKELHFRKNYDARQIVKLLKENGIKTTLKEVRSLIENATKKTSGKEQKNGP
jgi:hypothetical protein